MLLSASNRCVTVISHLGLEQAEKVLVTLIQFGKTRVIPKWNELWDVYAHFY